LYEFRKFFVLPIYTKNPYILDACMDSSYIIKISKMFKSKISFCPLSAAKSPSSWSKKTSGRDVLGVSGNKLISPVRFTFSPASSLRSSMLSSEPDDDSEFDEDEDVFQSTPVASRPPRKESYPDSFPRRNDLVDYFKVFYYLYYI